MKRFYYAVLLFLAVVGMQKPICADITPVDAIGFCKPYTWLFGDWVASPRLPLLGDINGDGYADFLYAAPQDKSLDVSLNGRGWKPIRGQRLLSGLPQTIQAICVGHFGGRGLDLMILGKEGGLVRALSAQNGAFSAATPIGTVSSLTGKAWLLAGKVASSTLDDVLVAEANGRVQVFDADGALLHKYTLGMPIDDAAVGDVDGDGNVELAARVKSRVVLYHLGETAIKFATIPAPKGQEALAMGDINGDGKADVLVDGRVFLAPDWQQTVSVPGWDTFTQPVRALMADVVGHHRADIVVQHEGKDYYGSTETDCDLYITYFKGDPDWDCDGLSNADEAKIGSDPLDRATSHDGLLDGWKVHGFDGIDLPGMGASPLHKDVLVMNLPYDNVPQDQMEKYMRDEVVPFFANLPYTNRDGTKGFAIHWKTQNPAFPVKGNEGKGWGQIAGETFPPDKIGLYHWMLIGGMGGGGQSGQLADAGSTGMRSWIHEFGHQLGLSHSGKWSTWAPTYTSLMNYSYSYGFEGDRKKVHFSRGELASMVLNESHLPGKVPFPIEKLQFLTGPPYHLHLKPAGADATYIDWGWTGVFSDRKVRANITYGYSVSGGERLQPSGKQSFNYNGPYELMTDYQASLAEHQGALYMVTANRPPLDPKSPRPESAQLVLQTYLGKRAWTPPITIAPHVTNDPCAVSDGQTFYVFYPTTEGVMYRCGNPDALSKAQLIPDSKGACVSAVNWKGTLRLFLYTGADKNIVYRTVRESRLGPLIDLGIKSAIPPGPAVDTLQNQLLLGTAGDFGNQPYRWQLRRFAQDKKSGNFQEVSCVFVGGEKSGWAGNRRPTLLFNPDREFGPQGRIYWIAAGLAQPLNTPTAFFIAQTIGYKDVNDGWLRWRYYDEWTNTRSGIGAAQFDKDITLATTWASGSAGGDGGVFCAYNGTAIGNTDMGDFDDVSLMANYGMARSIGTFARMPSAETKIRVACIGASITFGHGLPNREDTSYPAQLQKRLGASYDVRNFGVSGCTMLKHGDKPYWNEAAFAQAKAFHPNIVVIDLGGNDSKPQNWMFKLEFAEDTRALLEAFRTLPEKPRVLLCLPMPAFQTTFGINDTVIVNEAIPLLRKVAFENGAELIDLHTAFLDKKAWFADNIHPNTDGAAHMAKVIGESVAFQADAEFDLEKSLMAQGITPTVSSFYGYRQLVFPLEGGRQCNVVRPYRTAASHPYAWRGEFFGHEPQTDLALLARGYHVVYVDAQNMYGAPAAMEIWEKAYHLLDKTGLNGKIVLIGMSRGGLYCYHWAALHPETVAALYGDAPVCDFKSWPGGTFRTTTSKNEWEGLLRVYGFKEEAEALAYTQNPLDNLKPLVKAGIPIIHVVGQADTDVPVAENTDIVEKRYKELGGTIQVIRKPGVGHHPHSLANPEPIVEFIMRYAK